MELFDRSLNQGITKGRSIIVIRESKPSSFSPSYYPMVAFETFLDHWVSINVQPILHMSLRYRFPKQKFNIALFNLLSRWPIRNFIFPIEEKFNQLWTSILAINFSYVKTEGGISPNWQELANYLSLDVFSMKLPIVDTIFYVSYVQRTEPPFYGVIRGTRRSTRLMQRKFPHFSVISRSWILVRPTLHSSVLPTELILPRLLRGSQVKKAENYLSRWDQLITFLMTLFRHDLI